MVSRRGIFRKASCFLAIKSTVLFLGGAFVVATSNATTPTTTDLVIVVDNAIAGSNIGKMQDAVEILRKQAKENPTGVRLGLVIYAKGERVDNQGRAIIEAQLIIPLTSPKDFDEQYVGKKVQIWQVVAKSRLADGLEQGSEEFLRKSQSGARRTVVALTEGRIAGEESLLERLAQTAAGENIQWNFILYPFVGNHRPGSYDFLRRLAEKTGGQVFFPGQSFSEEDAARTFSLIPPPNRLGLECRNKPQGSNTIHCDMENTEQYNLFEWDFGDGTRETTEEPSVSHTYSKEGTYNVEVKARGTNTPETSIGPVTVTVGTVAGDGIATVERSITTFPDKRLLPGLTVEVTVKLTLHAELWSLYLEEAFPENWEDLQIKEPVASQRSKQSALFRIENNRITVIWHAPDSQPIAEGTVELLTYTVKVPDNSPPGKYLFEGRVGTSAVNGNQTDDSSDPPPSLETPKFEVKVESGLSVKEVIAFLLLEPPLGAIVSPCQPIPRSLPNCQLDLYDDLFIDSEEMRFAEQLWQKQLEVPFTKGQEIRVIGDAGIVELLCYYQRQIPVTDPCN